jgi:hypothetical protein
MKKIYDINYGTSIEKPHEECEVAVRVKLDKSITQSNDYPYVFLDTHGHVVKPTDEPPFMPQKRGRFVIGWLIPSTIVKEVKTNFGVEVTPIEVQMTTEL